MNGTNPKLKRISDDGQRLSVRKIFSTIQGEGPFTGRPAVFVRLAGCHLACSFCDTDFDMDKSTSMSPIQIANRVNELRIGATLVVLTGGEPMRQEVAPLCRRLTQQKLDVQIETSGSFMRNFEGWTREQRDRLSFVCSPKTRSVNEDLVPRVNAWKFIVSTKTEIDRMTGLPVDVFNDVGNLGVPVYIQPMDEGNEQKSRANLDRCIELSARYGHRLSAQVHKLIGMP